MDKKKLGGILTLLAIPAVVWAGEVVLPYTFSSGTPIRASEMNANFAALKAAVDSLDSRLSAAGAGLFKSGTRLKAITLDSVDGASVPYVYGGYAVLWDSQLGNYCIPQGYSQCYPLSGQFAYVDSTCTTRGVLAGWGGDFAVAPDGQSIVAWIAVDSSDGGFVGSRALASSAVLTQTYDLSQYSQSLPDGGVENVRDCIQSTTYDPVSGMQVPRQSMVAPITSTLQVSDFAAVSRQVH